MRAVLNHPHLHMTEGHKEGFFNDALALVERRVWVYALPDLLPTCIRGTSAALAPWAAWSPGRCLWTRAPAVQSKGVTSPSPSPTPHPPPQQLQKPVREAPSTKKIKNVKKSRVRRTKCFLLAQVQSAGCNQTGEICPFLQTLVSWGDSTGSRRCPCTISWDKQGG